MVAPAAVVAPSRALVAREVRRQEVRQAEKRVTQQWNNPAIPATGVAENLLSALVVGSNPLNQFAGNRIVPTGITLRYRVAAADSHNLIRVILLQNISGAVPGISTLLASVGSASTPLSPYNQMFHANVRILHDKMYLVDAVKPQATPLDKNGMWKTIYIPASKLQKIVLTSGNAIHQGAIYLFAYSDSNVIPNPTLDYFSEVKFID